MGLLVHKYGGTSVASVERIKNVALRIAKWHRAGHQLVVVASAMSGETDRLIGLAKQIQPQPDARELDVIASTGEQVTIGLLTMALKELGLNAKSYTGSQAKVLTDRQFTKARVLEIDDNHIRRELAKGVIVVVAGFQGADDRGNITTLGRGGSDTSAVALAAALHSDECLIYTDVDGIYTTDPHVVAEARRLDRITFEEMLEMASLGSKVLQARSVEFAGRHKVKVRVLSSLTDPHSPIEQEASSGTLITFDRDDKMEEAVISGIAFNRDEAKITVKRAPDRPGVAYEILAPIGEANINVDMIIQNASVEGVTDFSFTVQRSDYRRTMDILNWQVKRHLCAEEIGGDEQIAKVSLVGVGVRSHPAIASKMFRALAEEGINIQMISTSEIKISVILADKYLERAVRALHSAFDLEQPQFSPRLVA